MKPAKKIARQMAGVHMPKPPKIKTVALRAPTPKKIGLSIHVKKLRLKRKS